MPNEPSRSAAVCAFSVRFRMTQRDGRQGGDMPGSRTLLRPACLYHTGEPRRDVPWARPPAGVKIRWMIPGWRPSLSPGPSRVSGHPVVPEPSSSLGGIQASWPGSRSRPAP